MTKPESHLENGGNMVPPNSINSFFTDVSETQLDTFEYLRITDTTPIQPPVPVITINGQTISTEGNLITISGESKCGKSGFAGILISVALNEKGTVEGIEELFVKPNSSQKAILHFDTEQAKDTHKNNHLSILNRSGLSSCPDFFCSYNLRGLDFKAFPKITSEICDSAFTHFNGIHLIIIDGVAEYISDVNNPVESNIVIEYFEKLAIKYSTPLIITIPTTPGKLKELGFLGSFLQRRSESVLSIMTDGEISYVIPKYLRLADKKDIPPFTFTFDKNLGYHVGCNIETKIQPTDDTDRVFVISQLCLNVFGEGIGLLYEEAVDVIMKKTHRATGTAKGFFKEMKTHEMIIQGSDKKWKANLQYNYNRIEEN